MSKLRLTSKEKDVLRVLYENIRTFTSNKITKETHISWNTAKKYLEEFTKRKWIIRYKKGKLVYYSAYQF